jgi:hypothetical protein
LRGAWPSFERPFLLAADAPLVTALLRVVCRDSVAGVLRATGRFVDCLFL